MGAPSGSGVKSFEPGVWTAIEPESGAAPMVDPRTGLPESSASTTGACSSPELLSFPPDWEESLPALGSPPPVPEPIIICTFLPARLGACAAAGAVIAAGDVKAEAADKEIIGKMLFQDET